MTHYEHTKIAMADIPGLMHLARVHLDALAGLKGVLVVQLRWTARLPGHRKTALTGDGDAAFRWKPEACALQSRSGRPHEEGTIRRTLRPKCNVQLCCG